MMKIDLFSYSLLKSPKMFRFKTKYVYSNVYSLEREKVKLLSVKITNNKSNIRILLYLI